MRALIVFALIASAAALPSSSEPCSRGPGHWCSSPEAAKRCGATAHCVELWRNSDLSSPAADASEGCASCQLLAGDLRRLARAGQTPAQMRAAAVAACGLVPEAPAAETCRALATADGGLVDLLAAGLQSAKACVVTRQCRGRRDHPTLPAKSAAVSLRDLLLIRGAPLSAWKARQPSSDMCSSCILVLTSIKYSLGENSTQAEISTLLKNQVCPQLPSPLIDLCTQFADQYLGIVLNQMSQDMQPQQICTVFDFCNATSTLAKFRRHPVMQLMKLQSGKASMPGAPVQCELCEALVTEARQMLRDGRTQADIEKFVEDTVCRLLPAEKDQCVKNVQEYGPIIFQLLASELDPKTVCQAIGACGAGRVRVRNTSAAKAGAGPQCLLCEFVMREVEQQLGQNATQAEIEAALEQVCNLLPQSVRQECDSFVQQYTPMIIKLLVNGLSPEKVCTVLGLCTSVHARPAVAAVAAKRPRVSSTACDTCQTVILYAEALLKENATEHEIMQVVEKVCNFLPTAEQAACRELVEQYGAYVIQLMVQKVNPKQICQLIGLCQKTQSRNIPPVKPRLNVRVGAGPQCLLCEFVMREVEQQLGQNATQAEIEAALEQVCNLLPQSVRQECDSFVQQYTPMIIKLLVNGLSPEKVCTVLGLCISVHARPAVAAVAAKRPRVSSTACDVCQTVIQYAKALLNENATEQEIVQLVEKVCNFLPTAEQAACHSFLDQYGPYVIQLLLQDVDPKQICQLIGLCTKSQPRKLQVSAPRPRVQPRAGPQCVLCEFVMREVEQQLGQNSTQAEIEAALEQVCNLLPQSVRQECNNFVQQYTPIIIQLLVNGLGPKQVCTVLGLCTQSQRPVLARPAVAVRPPQMSSTACDVCQTVIQYAKALLNENATEQEIVQLVEKVCDFLPTAEQAACHSFVEQYGPYVVKLLLQDADPKQICQILGLCSSSSRRSALEQKMMHLSRHDNSNGRRRPQVAQTLRFDGRPQRAQRRPVRPSGLVQMFHDAEVPLI